MSQALSMFDSHRRSLAWAAGVFIALPLILAGRVSPLLTIALPLLVVVGLLVMRWPVTGLALLVASIPMQDLASFGSGEASLTATRAALVLALFGYAATITFGRQRLHGTRLLIPFAVLLIWMAGTAVTANDQAVGVADVFRWTTALLTFVVAVQLLLDASNRTIVTVIAVTAGVGAIEAGFGAVLGILGFGPASFRVENAFARAFGTFGRPNTFGGYLEMSVFPVLWLAAYSVRETVGRFARYRQIRQVGFHESSAARRDAIRSVLVTTLLVASTATMLGGVLLSFSRGAWLGVVAGLAVSIVVALRRFWVTALALAPVVALVAVFATGQLGSSVIGERFGSILDEARPFDAASISITPDNFAVAERMAHWQAGWRMFIDDPLTGVGAGNFNPSYPDYFVRSTFRFSQGHAHNFYIHMLAENGIPGLFLYVTVAVSFLLLAFVVALRSTDPFSRALALGALGSMSAVYLHNVFENLHVLNLSVQISLVWALSVVAHRRWRLEPPRDGSVVEYSR